MSKKKNGGTLTPVVVLTVICLLITGALVATYQVTAPIIEANKAVGNEELAVILPESGGAVSEIVADKLPDIQTILAADNGEGFIFTVVKKGFGGEIEALVGVNKKGEVTGIKINEQSETPNLGTKALEEDHLSKFIGNSSITMSDESGKTQIDAITGATVSSTAVFNIVDAALQQFQKMGGGV